MAQACYSICTNTVMDAAGGVVRSGRCAERLPITAGPWQRAS
jgi:hypothetical protein